MGNRFFHNLRLILLDTKWYDVARVATDVWGGGIVAYAETLTRYYPIDEDRKAFVENVKRDMLNLDYHMIISLYR
jgi:hypothetical protein